MDSTSVQERKLLDLSESVSLFHSQENEEEGYGTISINGHQETWALNSPGFRNWFRFRYLEEFHEPPKPSALKNAINCLTAKAQFLSPALPVFLRLAPFGQSICLDLCNPGWEVVMISPTGWQVQTESPVKFTRARGMRSLSHPVGGGDLGELTEYTNMSIEDIRVLVFS